MKLVGMFNQIEEMPFKAFKEGVEWNWETFEEYIERISAELSINVAPWSAIASSAYGSWATIP